MKKITEVSKYCESLLPIFFLQGWDVDIVQGKDNGDVAAECFTRERYRQCQLTIFKKFWGMSEAEQKGILVHEMCHNITGIQNSLISSMLNGGLVTESEMFESFERETSWMANIINRLLNR